MADEEEQNLDDYIPELQITDDNITIVHHTEIKVDLPINRVIRITEGPPHTEGWSDDVVREWINKNTFPDIQGTRDLWPDYLKRFWSFYITGSYPESFKLCSVIGCIVLMTPDVNDKLEYKPLLRFNSEKLDDNVTTFKVGNIKSNLSTNFSYEAETQAEENDMFVQHNFRTNDYKKFSTYINTRLKAFPITGVFSSEDRKFLDLSTAIALMCLRALIKSKKSLEFMFFNKKLKYDLERLLFLKNLVYAPPCMSFIDSLTYLTKNSKPNTHVIKPLMLAIIEKSDQDLENNLELLKFTCMTSMKFNGLILIKLLLQVMEVLKLEWNVLIPYLLFDRRNILTLKLIRTFLIENIYKKPPQYSWYWCRIFDDSYYYHLGPDKHPLIATILGKIIELDTKSTGIWDSSWAKKICRFPRVAEKIGILLYEEFKSNDRTELLQLE